MVVTFGFISPTVAIVVLVIALVIFGPGKLPDLGKSLGKSITEFKAATTEKEDAKATTAAAAATENQEGKNAG
ncbi:MAG: twin-arginine translocase TatA/TatE family subunit [Peptococcaceae bacterium]|nr:twin-arginine translocase TatA/TatE family subunit [Peptococcaceae bacterium]